MKIPYYPAQKVHGHISEYLRFFDFLPPKIHSNIRPWPNFDSNVIQKDTTWDVGTCSCNSYSTSLFFIVSGSFKWSIPILPSKLVNTTTLMEPIQYGFIRCNMLRSIHRPFGDHFIPRTFSVSRFNEFSIACVKPSFSKNFQNIHSDIRPWP